MSKNMAPVVTLKSDSVINNEQDAFVGIDDSSMLLISETKSKLDAYYKTGATQSLTWRMRQLRAIKQFLVKEEKQLQAALYQDLKKSPEESFFTEIGFLLKDLAYFLKNLEKWMKPRKTGKPLLTFDSTNWIQAEPLGTCLIMSSWNYPLQLSISPMIAAIAAGNCVLLKPSEIAPETSAAIARLLPKYIDMNAIAVVEGGVEPTTHLLNMPFDKIFYTGGDAVAKIVMQAAAKHLTPVTLELGGKSPCIIDKEVNLDMAINRVVWGKLMNCGQTCIAPDYLLVHHSHMDAVIEKLKASIVKQYKKSPKENKFYGRIVNQKHLKRLVSYLQEQKVVFGGEYDLESNYMAPTIVMNPDPNSPLMQEEIFGPIIPVVGFNGRADMLDFICDRAKPLAAYVFTEDKEFQERFTQKISAGAMCVNDTNLFMINPELPFGGVGGSGMGRYHGKFGFDNFSHHKAIMKKSFTFDSSIRYMPLNRLKMWALRRLLK